MTQTFTIEIDARRFKVLNTMMQATFFVPADGFNQFLATKGLTKEHKDLCEEISDKAHAMNMCTDPGCAKPQSKDVAAL